MIEPILEESLQDNQQSPRHKREWFTTQYRRQRRTLASVRRLVFGDHDDAEDKDYADYDDTKYPGPNFPSDNENELDDLDPASPPN